MTKMLAERFEYLDLSDEDRKFLAEQTDAIRGDIKTSCERIILAGTRLLTVKDRIKHGNFVPWLDVEFGWKVRTAQNMMKVAAEFKNANFAYLDIAPSALYLLAAATTPEAVREKFVEKAKTEEVTHKEVKAAIDTAKKTKKAKKKPAQKKPATKKKASPPEPVNDMDFVLPKKLKKHRGRALFTIVMGAVSSTYRALYKKQLDWDRDARRLSYLIGEIIEKAIEDRKGEIVADVKAHVNLFCEKMEEGKMKDKFNPQTLLKWWPDLTRLIDHEETKRLAEIVRDKKKQEGLFRDD